MMAKKVLLTGISGFVGQHCAAELIKNGYIVRGSLRSFSKIDEVKKGLSKVVDCKGKLEFCVLNLLKDSGWDEAMEGCDYVLHVASPFVIAEPKNEEEIIQPAIQGTLRALKAAQKAGVKKVVITSSTVAMAGDKKINHLTQDSWTDPEKNKVTVYIKSKALAERAAWEYYNKNRNISNMELTVINPGPIYGPTLTGNLSGASMDMIKKIITGKMPMLPNAHYVMSDVRDVAKIHVKALINSASNGKRFLVTSLEPHSFVSIAQILKAAGFDKASPKVAPSFLVKFMSLFNREMKGMLPFVDAKISADIASTQKVFSWQPLPLKKTILDTANSIKELL